MIWVFMLLLYSLFRAIGVSWVLMILLDWLGKRWRACVILYPIDLVFGTGNWAGILDLHNIENTFCWSLIVPFILRENLLFIHCLLA